MKRLLKKTIAQWHSDNAPAMAAATAYYAIFSLAPFIIITVTVGSALLSASAVQEYFFTETRERLGPTGADAVQSIVKAAQESPESGITAAISIVILLLAASGLLKQLQQNMNIIWRVQPDPRQNVIKTMLMKRVFSIAMIFIIGFLFLASLVATAFVSSTINMLLPVLNFLLSFGFTTLLFALLYKFLPDVRLSFRHVWPGALLASLLFTIGQFALGFYIGQRDFTEAYGIAGSVILILLWANYSSQILYLGATFVRQYTLQHNIDVEPVSNAVFIPEPGKVVTKRSRFSLLRRIGVTAHVLLFESKAAWKMWKIWRRWKK